MTYQQRREVSELLDRRDVERRARREDRMNELTGAAEGQDAARATKFKSYGTIADDREEVDQEDNKYVETDVNLEAFDVPLREWISQERTRREIKKRFRNFLRKYRASGSTSVLHQVKIRSVATRPHCHSVFICCDYTEICAPRMHHPSTYLTFTSARMTLFWQFGSLMCLEI